MEGRLENLYGDGQNEWKRDKWMEEQSHENRLEQIIQ